MSNLLGNMSKFANQDDNSQPNADEIFRLAMSHFCGVGGVSAAEIKVKQLQEPYKSKFDYCVNKKIKFSKELQAKINADPDFKSWVAKINLGVFLDNTNV